MNRRGFLRALSLTPIAAVLPAASRAAAGPTIVADKLQVNTLSAITANVGKARPTLIVDGAITASRISAGVISAGQIASNVIPADVVPVLASRSF